MEPSPDMPHHGHCGSLVGVLAVTNVHDVYELLSIINPIDHPIIPDSDTPKVSGTAELLDTYRSGVGCKGIDHFDQP